MLDSEDPSLRLFNFFKRRVLQSPAWETWLLAFGEQGLCPTIPCTDFFTSSLCVRSSLTPAYHRFRAWSKVSVVQLLQMNLNCPVGLVGWGLGCDVWTSLCCTYHFLSSTKSAPAPQPRFYLQKNLLKSLFHFCLLFCPLCPHILILYCHSREVWERRQMQVTILPCLTWSLFFFFLL